VNPHYGTAVLVPDGNGGSSGGSLPAIDHRVGLGTLTMGAPSFTLPRALGLLEKITPPSVNATKGIQTAQARVRAIMARFAGRTKHTATGYARSLTMRQRAS
jgi:hypothetical protein